jgi:surface protein
MKRIALLIGIMCIVILVFHCGSAMAASGTHDGIDWDLTDGVLTLGKEGETQTLTNQSSRSASSWPWYSQRATITSVVTNGNLVLQGSLASMFFGCNSLTSLDLSGFNTSDVTNMYDMFLGCSNLTSLDLSGFKTLNVTNMREMFYKCSSLTSLDLSGFNTLMVTNMSSMFYDCSSLCSVTLGENNPFKGSGTSVYLPTPPASEDGIRYTRKWIRNDRQYGPYTPTELRDNYTAEMAGTWVWEKDTADAFAVFVMHAVENQQKQRIAQ